MNPYGTELGLWRQMDWLMRVDVVVLGLLLAYTFGAVIRASHHYHKVRREAEVNDPAKRRVAAELNIHVGNLRSIVTIAPYLGLIGTCLGLLHALFYAGGQYDSALAALAPWMAPALVPAASGIIVAISSTCGYEYARTRLDSLLDDLPSGKHLLTRRFMLPPYSLIAAYGLAFIVQVYMPFSPARTPKGLDTGIAPVRCGSDTSDRLIVLHISDSGRIFVNLEEQDWSNLPSRLSDIYSRRAHRVLYLSADDEVPFQTVADSIDIVNSLDITVLLITPTAMNAPCPKPLVPGAAS